MTDPTPGSRETLDPALIERCARAGFEKWHPGWPTGAWSETTQAYRDGWADVARAVLEEAAAAAVPNPRAEAARRLRVVAEMDMASQKALKHIADWLDLGPSDKRDAVARALLCREKR